MEMNIRQSDQPREGQGQATVDLIQAEKPYLPQARTPDPIIEFLRRRWRWLIVGLLVLGLGIASMTVVLDRLTPRPIEVVRGFYTALNSEDYQEAHSYLSRELASQYSVEQLRESWTALVRHSANLQVSTTDFPENFKVNPTPLFADQVNELDQQKSRVAQILWLDEDHYYVVVLNLDRVDSEWRIVGVGRTGLVPEPGAMFIRF